MAKKFYKGLGDLFIKVNRPDNPALTIDLCESLARWSVQGTGSVALSQTHVLNGNYAVQAVTTAVNSGVKYTPAAPINWSAYSGKVFLANIWATAPGTITLTVNQLANTAIYTYTVIAGWNRVLIDLSAPTGGTGTVNWTIIDSFTLTAAVATSFWVDGTYFFASLADVARREDVRIACINEITLEGSDETIDLYCSRNQLVETEITTTEIVLGANVKDHDPAGLALMGAGEMTTDSVTKMIEGEAFVVPSTPFQYTLVNATTLKVGDGYGVWIVRADTDTLLQRTPDPTIIKPGYYYLNTATGQITFNANEAGVAMLAYYNVVTSGKTFEAKTSRSYQEFSLQFQALGSNGKTGLLYCPRLKSSSLSHEFSLDDFWGWSFEGKLLIDTNSGNYYEFHTTD